jgi:hypothetical protein
MPKPKGATKALNPLEAARTFYGEAFDAQTPRALSASMRDWSRLSPDEQSFAVAHLTYLQIESLGAMQKLLAQGLRLLDEVAESLTTAIEESLPDREPDPDVDDEDDDGRDDEDDRDDDDDGDDDDDPAEQRAPNTPEPPIDVDANDPQEAA